MSQTMKRKRCISPALRLTGGKRIALAEKRDDHEGAVARSLQTWRDSLFDFAMERDQSRLKDGEEREDLASEWLENMVSEGYGEMKHIMLDLLPFLGPMQQRTEEHDYDVVQTNGWTPPRQLEKGRPAWVELGKKLSNGVPKMEKLLAARMAGVRHDPRFQAWEAFCAAMSLLSARKEKNWIELFGTREELEEKLKDMIKKGKLRKSKTCDERKDEIRQFLEHEATYGKGYFAHYLVKPHATMRVALAPGKTLTPASLVITERCALFDCLASPNDDEGDAPLRAAAKSYDWCKRPGTQFALQDINLGIEEKDVKCRVAAKDLQPDQKLRSLLLNKRAQVVYLEVVASLAPRGLAKEQGHSAIVKAELARIMREAKNNGEAVVFSLGSDSPHTLFEKVYNRPPISDYGLRCGYLRWRGSADEAWARESPWADRSCICLQMP